MTARIISSINAVVAEKGKLNWPNIFTSFRVLITPLTVWFIWQGKIELAIIFFAVAAVSDALDGWWARTYKQKTKFGELLDPIADKIFVLAILGILLSKGLWLFTFIVIFFREAFIFFGRAAVLNTKIEKAVSVTWQGKCKAISQYLGLGYSILGWPGFNWVMLSAVLITVWSGVDYFFKFKKALKNKNNA